MFQNLFFKQIEKQVLIAFIFQKLKWTGSIAQWVVEHLPGMLKFLGSTPALQK
jgi:hypothetical protein